MSNTNTKVTNYIIQGYVFMVEESAVKAPVELDESSTEVPEIQNVVEVVEENILPVNNNVLQTVNYQMTSGGMRI